MEYYNKLLLIYRFPTFHHKSTVVQGTFDDLSQEEKTKAFLQFLQYHQQQEQEQETKKFQQLFDQSNEPEDNAQLSETDEKVVEESLKIWYGLSTASNPHCDWLMTVSLITIVQIYCQSYSK